MSGITNLKIVYCEDRRFVCNTCKNDVAGESKRCSICKGTTKTWAGCYCCDEKSCCNNNRCTCNFQYLTKDPEYGYIAGNI